MRRQTVLAIAVMMAALVVVAPGAAFTGSQLAVASQNTTDTDFNNADTLENVTVNGTGNSASVDLKRYDFFDGFEDEPADSGVPDSWEHVSDNAITEEVTTAKSTEGSQSYHVNATSNKQHRVRPSFHPISNTDKNITVSMYASRSRVTLRPQEDGADSMLVSIRNGDLQYFDGSWNTITTAVDNGEWVDLTLYNFDASTDSAQLEWSEPGGSSGTATVNSPRDITTGWDSLELVVKDGEGYFDRVGTGTVTKGEYISANHTVENAEQANINLTLDNASAVIAVDEYSGGSWSQVNAAVVTTSANHTLDISSATSSTLRTKVLFSAGSGTTTARLHDESILFTARSPTVDNSSATPTGEIKGSNPTFEIDVNDSDFPLDQGDTVTAELWVSGSNVGQDSLTSNGTASVQHDPDLGQTLTYQWNLSDSYGGEQVSDTFSIKTPGNITFREEHNASKIVTGVNASIILYSIEATTIVRLEDSNDDGNISLAGLPDKEFVAVVNAEQHYNRRVYIESIYNQKNIFILNSTFVPGAEVANTTFVFEDRTGRFQPDNTSLRIQRALDVNNNSSFEWLTVAGDYWGAAGEFPFTGEIDARYRLVVENQEGQRRILGTHIPVEDGTKRIIAGEIQWDAGNATGRFFDAAVNRDQGEIEGIYVDPAKDTSEVRVQVWELGNQSNEIFDQTFSNGPYGTLTLDPLVALNSNQTDKSWVVTYTYTLTDGTTDVGRITVGSKQVNLPMDPWLLAAFAILGITFVGTLYGPRTATIGAWSMVLLALGLTVLGLAAIPMAGIILGMMVAAGGTFYREAVP